jgi:nitrogen fixation/metabolism regulation signal transduction histidine kinase
MATTGNAAAAGGNAVNPLKDAKQTALDLSAMAEKEALALANSKRNEIKEIRNHKQLEKVDLDFDSPRLKQALYNLGVSKEECMKKYA